jgi:hypothetical protein
LLLLVTVGFLLIMPARQIEAMVVRTLSLEEITRRADRIFVGTCVGMSEASSESGQPITEITFKIIDPIKGASGDRLTIRQIRGGSGMVPGYAVGQEVLLFLHPESATGLTSPVGMGQGMFTILRQGDRHNKAIAVGDGALGGRLALRRAKIASGASRSAAAITSPGSESDNERGVELELLIRAARQIIGEGTR